MTFQAIATPVSLWGDSVALPPTADRTLPDRAITRYLCDRRKMSDAIAPN